MSRDFHYIAIEGVLGVGKTTFAKMLSEDLEAKLVWKQVLQTFLEKFYKEMNNFAWTPADLPLNRAVQGTAQAAVESHRKRPYFCLHHVGEFSYDEKIYSVVVNESSAVNPTLSYTCRLFGQCARGQGKAARQEL